MKLSSISALKKYLKTEYLEHKDCIVEGKVFSRAEVKIALEMMTEKDYAFISYHINPHRNIFGTSQWNRKIADLASRDSVNKYRKVNQAVNRLYKVMLENSKQLVSA